MDVELKIELLKLAKSNIELGIEAIELVALNDDKRGDFYGSNTAEYMRDALKAPKGLDGYIDDLEKERDAAIEVVLDWAEVVVEEGYEPVRIGDHLKIDDHIYLAGTWDTIQNTFKDKANLFIGYVYTGKKFYVTREKEKADAKKLPEVPQGFRALRPGEKIRWSDKVWTTTKVFSAFSEMNATTKTFVGTPYNPDSLLMVIRSVQIGPENGTVLPLPNFRELTEKEIIRGNDMVRFNRVWMAADSGPVSSKHGNLIGILYNPKSHPMITRLKAELIKADSKVDAATDVTE